MKKTKLFRVNYSTGMLVEADTWEEARDIGMKCLMEEVKKGKSVMNHVEQLASVQSLRQEEMNCFPWRSQSKNSDQEILAKDFFLKNRI